MHAGGAVYEGEWLNAMRDGHGKYFYANGSRFEGDNSLETAFARRFGTPGESRRLPGVPTRFFFVVGEVNSKNIYFYDIRHKVLGK